MTTETLTPVYAVFYVLQHTSGFNHYAITTGSNHYRHAKELTEGQARARVKSLQTEGFAAYSYHYGWKQRGFRPQESSCTPLCHNKLMMDYATKGKDRFGYHNPDALKGELI